MKINLVNNLLKFLLILVLFSMPIIGFAQSDPDPGCDPLDPACPIDGGLSALLVLGAGYGIKKVRDARKTSNNA
jgi:hypothetical protein